MTNGFNAALDAFQDGWAYRTEILELRAEVARLREVLAQIEALTHDVNGGGVYIAMGEIWALSGEFRGGATASTSKEQR